MHNNHEEDVVEYQLEFLCALGQCGELLFSFMVGDLREVVEDVLLCCGTLSSRGR